MGAERLRAEEKQKSAEEVRQAAEDIRRKKAAEIERRAANAAKEKQLRSVAERARVDAKAKLDEDAARFRKASPRRATEAPQAGQEPEFKGRGSVGMDAKAKL